MTDLVDSMEAAASVQVPPRKFERAEVMASVGILIAALALVVGASKPSGSDLANVQRAVSAVEADSVTTQDLGDLTDRLGATEKALADAQASLAELQTMSQDMAAASKVDAIVRNLQSSIDSLRSDVDDLCSEVRSLSYSGPVTVPVLPYGSC